MIKSLSVIFPVFNEEKRLWKTFKALESWNAPVEKLEVIFVDDGSFDKTREAIESWRTNFSKKIIFYGTNRGKGYAIREGMKASTGDYSLFLDADMSTGFESLENFLPHLKNGADCLFGTRKKVGAEVKVRQPRLRQILGEGYTKIANVTSGVYVSDFTCGFKMFSKEARGKIFKSARINRWSFDVEIAYLAKKFGFEIIEVPVVWQNDKETKVRLAKELIPTFIDLLRIRLFSLTGRYK